MVQIAESEDGKVDGEKLISLTWLQDSLGLIIYSIKSLIL